MSPRVRVDVKDGLIVLNITNAVPEDSGVYRILVRNPSSEITSSCTVNVYETNQPTATVPLFTNTVKGMSSKAYGDSPLASTIVFHFHVSIRCEVSSVCFN